jgi:cytochrome c oxidase subunit II
VNRLQFWPQSASTAATEVDHLFIALLLVSFLVLGLVFGLMIYFGTKYRAGSTADRSDEHLKSWHWEVAWTTVTLLMFLALFFWGGDLYARLYRPPPNALDIYIVGKQWMWKAQHADGQAEINELHVPVGRPVRLVMTSQDVIHSFYVPAFRLKHDVLPGRYEMLWFEATVTGTYPLFCAEFCGTDHSQMGGRIVVTAPAAYERWLAARGPSSTMAQQGEALFRQLGCSGCHGANSTVRAPPLEGLYGRPVPLQGGGTVIADDQYIRDSILLPKSQIAAGYAAVMPSFAGQIEEEDVLKLTAYLRSLATAAPPPENPPPENAPPENTPTRAPR